MEFYTKNYTFRQMEKSEIKELEIGDKVSICINKNIPQEMEFIDTIVTAPMFLKNNIWGIETTNGFFDNYSIYEIKER